MFLRGLEGWHIVIIVALLAVLFGSRRLPGAARSLGQSLRIFKSEMKAAKDDEEPGGSGDDLGAEAGARDPHQAILTGTAAPRPTRLDAPQNEHQPRD
jgi:sec-independent protein translocase protein TatA